MSKIYPASGHYRAAYWISHDSQNTVLLTDEGQADLPDDELIEAGEMLAKEINLVMDGGQIILGHWSR